MSWNAALISGPILVPVYGAPAADDVRPIVGIEPGYHLNVAPELMTPELEPHRVTPVEPACVFFGAPTIFLRFADEAEARASGLEALRA